MCQGKMGMMAVPFLGLFLLMVLASPVHGRIRRHGAPLRQQQQQQQQPLLQHPHQQIVATVPSQYHYGYDDDYDYSNNRHVQYDGVRSPWIEQNDAQEDTQIEQKEVHVKRNVPSSQQRRHLGKSSKSSKGSSKSNNTKGSSKSKSAKSSKSARVPTRFPTLPPNTAVPTAVPTTLGPTTLGPTITGTTATPTTAPPTTLGSTAPPSTAPPSTSPPTSITGTTATPLTIVPTPLTTAATARIAPFDCTPNPQDYNVNVDLQIQYPEDFFAACDSAEQDAAINTNIQAALNENFATAVPDWQGSATFGAFRFDSNQEVNNVNPFGRLRNRRLVVVDDDIMSLSFDKHQLYNANRQLQLACPSRAAVACTTPDFCRWGCLTASTTNCGTPPSTTASWGTNLANVIRTRLASLGYDCLGIPDQLQVLVVVDNPIAPAARSAGTTTDITTRANGFLETEFPESEVTSRTFNDNAVAAKVAANSGVELETIQQVSSSVTPVPANVPTSAPTKVPTLAPTKVPTLAPSIAVPTAVPTTPSPTTLGPTTTDTTAKSSAVIDNAVTANVADAFAANIAVQSETIQQLSSTVEPGTGSATRPPTPSPAPPDSINTKNSALDAAVPMTAEQAIAMADDQNVDIRSYNNNGEPCTQDFVLYTVNVDVQITNTNEDYCSDDPDAVASMRDAVTQAMNDNFGTTVPDWRGDVGFFPIFWDAAQQVPAGRSNAGEERHQRALQFSSCAPRSIECTTNNCMWGCLWASTTNCGMSTLTNWANLGDDIQTALADLGLDCLGTTDQLQVNVLVDDPVVLVEDSSTDVLVEDSSTNNENEVKPTRGTPGTTLLSAPIKEGDDTATDDQGPSTAFQIHSQVSFTFFQGKGREPKSNEIEDMTAKFKEFFTRVFKSNDKFAPAFQDIEFSKLIPKYNAATSPDEFFIEFITTVLVDETAEVTSSEAAHVMAKSSLTDFITHYLKKSPWSAFSQTMKILFKAVTQDA